MPSAPRVDPLQAVIESSVRPGLSWPHEMSNEIKPNLPFALEA